tara:strand:+ start:1477 stop:2283 length:807 start_codon:yes stop_codon:yes gene_type:complete
MFFVRCYRKGAAKSGTTNLQEWDECPNLNEFVGLCESNGHGKYILFQRGKGIRGMKKVNEYIVSQQDSESKNSTTTQQNGTNNGPLSELLVFAAEEMGIDAPSIALKKNVSANSLDDGELLDVMESMVGANVSSAEEFESFSADIKALLKEVRKRGMSSEGYSEAVAKNAEGEPLGKKGMGFLAGMVVGGLTGVGATAYHYKGKITEMEERFGALEASMAETEKTVKKQAKEMENEKKATEAVRQFDNRLNLDASFLSNFNGNNGPHY